MGLIAEYFNSMAIAYLVPMIAHLYVVYYSYYGSKPSGPLYDLDEEQPVVSH